MFAYPAAVVAILCSSIAVSLLEASALPSSAAYSIIVGLVLVLLLSLNGLRHDRFKPFIAKHGRWPLLSLTTLLVQLIVLATGGLRSPFFILFHLSVLGLSLIFDFITAMVFLGLSLLALLITLTANPIMLQLVSDDLGASILYALSFLSIIPLAQVLAHRYHLKDQLSQMLQNQLVAEEAILESVSDMVIITDQSLAILSVNDATEHLLGKPRAELIQHSLFDVIFLKDRDGKLLNAQSMALAESTTAPLVLSGVTLLGANTLSLPVTVRVQPITDLEGQPSQLSFVISDLRPTASPSRGQAPNVEQAKVWHAAAVEDLKKRLQASGTPDLHARLILIASSEQDIFATQALHDRPITIQKTPLDVTVLCQEVVRAEQDFGHVFNTSLSFQLLNFGEQQIAPLVSAGYPARPEQLTGPFFTVPADVNYLGLAIHKLLDICVMLASSSPNRVVQLAATQDPERVYLHLVCSSPTLSPADKQVLFTPFYPALASRTNLHFGSGLEGFLAKTVCDQLTIPLHITLQPNQLGFTLPLNKQP